MEAFVQALFPSVALGKELSPYLFIIGIEILMRLVNREVSRNNLSTFKVSSLAPPISKLCYADDVILFCKAKIAELITLKNCLENYCSWSGQIISVEKFGVFPSKGVSRQFHNQIKCSWGLNAFPQSTSYLGVPLYLSKNRSHDLKFVKDKLENKHSGWNSKNLSWVGSATLIKSVAQSIPTYTMVSLQFPKNLCDQLDAVVHRFWWNPKMESGSFWTPKAWSTLCRPLKEGGIGF